MTMPDFRPFQPGDRVRWVVKSGGGMVPRRSTPREGTIERILGSGRKAVAEVRQDGGARAAVALVELRRPGEPLPGGEPAPVERAEDGAAEQGSMF